MSDKAVPKESQETFARITQVDASETHTSQSRTFRAAWSDLVRGFLQHELWLQLGWQDIKQQVNARTIVDHHRNGCYGGHFGLALLGPF